MSERIERIKKAVEQLEKCKATHVHSVPVTEKHEREVAWGGVVEMFDLEGHATAKRAYAWERQRDEKGDAEYTVVLGVGPVTSAQAAVKAAITAILKQM